MKNIFFFILFLLSTPLLLVAQEKISTIEDINLDNIPPNQIRKYWLKMIDDWQKYQSNQYGWRQDYSFGDFEIGVRNEEKTKKGRN